MATSSITKNFIIETKNQVERFANTVYESYLESLNRKREVILMFLNMMKILLKYFLAKGIIINA